MRLKHAGSKPSIFSFLFPGDGGFFFCLFHTRPVIHIDLTSIFYAVFTADDSF